jgi:hypothetical protein
MVLSLDASKASIFLRLLLMSIKYLHITNSITKASSSNNFIYDQK